MANFGINHTVSPMFFFIHSFICSFIALTRHRDMEVTLSSWDLQPHRETDE